MSTELYFLRYLQLLLPKVGPKTILQRIFERENYFFHAGKATIILSALVQKFENSVLNTYHRELNIG